MMRSRRVTEMPKARPPRFGSAVLLSTVLTVVWSALLSVLLGTAGCSTPDEKKTLAQILRENGEVLRQLASYDPPERQLGIAWVKKHGKERGSAIILYLLNDPQLDNYRVEVVLARILADWKDARAIPYLLEHLESPDRGAAGIAMEGLLVFGPDRRILDALDEALDKPNPQVRRRAAEMLAQIRSPEVVDRVAARTRGEKEPEVRALFWMAILQSTHPRRVELLVDGLTDGDEAIRELVWAGLQRTRGVPKVSYDSAAPAEERARGVALLRLWLRRHEGRAQIREG